MQIHLFRNYLDVIKMKRRSKIVIYIIAHHYPNIVSCLLLKMIYCQASHSTCIFYCWCRNVLDPLLWQELKQAFDTFFYTFKCKRKENTENGQNNYEQQIGLNLSEAHLSRSSQSSPPQVSLYSLVFIPPTASRSDL